MRSTRDYANTQAGRARKPWLAARAALCVLLGVTLLGMFGCSGATKGTSNPTGTASTVATATGRNMAGPTTDVHVSETAILATPKNWALTTPQSAVRSYLAWTKYIYRIGQSDLATSAMSPNEFVRVDAYNQYNLENQRLLDETLDSVAFGAVRGSSTTVTVPAVENWTYSYLSIQQGNKLSGGPYQASYDSTYTVVKNKKGNWLVDSVKVTPKGTVK